MTLIEEYFSLEEEDKSLARRPLCACYAMPCYAVAGFSHARRGERRRRRVEATFETLRQKKVGRERSEARKEQEHLEIDDYFFRLLVNCIA